MAKQHRRGRSLIKQRPDSPNWYCNFSVRGRRFRGSLETIDESEAAIRAAQLRADALKGTVAIAAPPAPVHTLDTACGSYWREIGDYAGSAIDMKRRIETIRSYFGKTTPLAEITTGKISAFVATRRGTPATRRKGALLSPSTINREITLLRSILIRARDVHGAMIPEIKWRLLFLEEADERETILSHDDEGRLFDHLRADYWPLVHFATISGQRLDNIRTLRWSQIDWSRQTITFRIKSKKPGGKTHVIPLTDALKAILSVERGRHPEFVFTYDCRLGTRVHVLDDNGKRVIEERIEGQRYPFSKYGWRRDWRKALKAAGLSEARFHDLRHTAAMRTLAGSGGNIKVVMRQLGHADLKTSMRYLRANMDDLRQAMELAQNIDTTTDQKKKA